MAYKKITKEEYQQQQKDKLDNFMFTREKAIIDSMENMNDKLPPWEAPVFHSKCINPASGVRYRVENTVSLGQQMYNRSIQKELDKDHEYSGMPFFMTFMQAKQNGLTVKKGSKSYTISKSFGKKVGEREDINDEGETITEDVYKRRISLDSVFHISDLNGEINDKLKRNMDISFQKPTDLETRNILEALIESSPSEVERVSFFKASSGSFYSDTFDKVTVPPSSMFKNDLEEFSTIAHEISHSWGIKGRQDRECFAKYHTHDKYRAEEELVANVSAQAVVSHFNLDMSEDERVEAFSRNHDTYDFGWAKCLQKDTEAVSRAIRAADKTASKIISDIEHNLAMKLEMNPDLAVPEFLKDRLLSRIEKNLEAQAEPAIEPDYDDKIAPARKKLKY